MRWKLIHKNQHECIENEGGKTLSYNPNLGIQIIEEDGFAFKDLMDNGVLDPFEDWRLPLTMRVKDFTSRFHLWQENGCLYYEKGRITLPIEFCASMEEYKNNGFTLIEFDMVEEDIAYLKNNYIIAALLLMFDNDFDMGKEDYLLQLMVQSMDLGLLENIVYSIIEALKKFIQKNIQNQIALRI